jgi:hypothetical protein
MSGCHIPNCMSPCCHDLLDMINELSHIVSALLLDRVKELERWPSLIQHLDRSKNDLQEQINRLEQSREAHSRSNKDLFDRVSKLEGKKVKNMIPCPVCNGTGEVHQKMVADRDYQIAQKGETIIRITTCTMCGGNKKVECI